MDAVEYLRAFYRMCDSNKYCSSCEAIGICQNDCEKAEQMVEIVEKWAKEHLKKEHLKKTRMDKFLEVFPNADVHDGFCDICPKYVEPSYKVNCNETQSCTDCEREYWTEEIE